MRRLTARLLAAVLMLFAVSGAAAEGDAMDVMQTILSLKEEFPDKAVFQDIAIRARKELGTPVRQITYRWEQGRFFADVTFGSTLVARTPVMDAEGRFQAVLGQAEYPYLLYLPAGYDPSRSYPTILFLHGIGERGDDPSVIADYGPFQYLLSGHTLDMIVIAPQVEASAHWVDAPDEQETDAQMVRLAAFVEQMRAAYAIDDSRFYLTGLSMGGRGAYKLACFMPDTFAAVAVCCGRAGKYDQPREIVYDLSLMANRPVWLFHGLSDETVDANHALAGMERLLACNAEGSFRLTLYPAVGHDCYEYAYQDDGLYAWLAGWRKSEE